METIKSWFEDLILGFPFVVDNVRNAYQKGELDGSQTINIAEKNDEILALINRIEMLKVQESDAKQEIVDLRAIEMLNDLLSNVDMKKVVTLDKQHGIVFIGGERASEGRLGNLRSEAEFLLNSDLWSIISETPKELAQRAMFTEGENVEKQLAKGRTILYTLSTQRNILDIFRGFIPKSK